MFKLDVVNGKHKSCVVYHVNNYQETRFISLDVVDTSNKTLAKSILNITYYYQEIKNYIVVSRYHNRSYFKIQNDKQRFAKKKGNTNGMY